MSEKLCAFCANMKWDGIDYRYWSELTGGDMQGGFTCDAGKFHENRPDDDKEYRVLMLRAETCDSYTPTTGATK